MDESGFDNAAESCSFSSGMAAPNMESPTGRSFLKAGGSEFSSNVLKLIPSWVVKLAGPSELSVPGLLVKD